MIKDICEINLIIMNVEKEFNLFYENQIVDYWGIQIVG